MQSASGYEDMTGISAEPEGSAGTGGESSPGSALQSRFARWLALPTIATSAFSGRLRLRHRRHRPETDFTLSPSPQRIKGWMNSSKLGWRWNSGYSLLSRFRLIWAPRHLPLDPDPQQIEGQELATDGNTPGAVARHSGPSLAPMVRRRNKGHSAVAGPRYLSGLGRNRPTAASPADSRREGPAKERPQGTRPDMEAAGLELPFSGKQESESIWQSRPVDLPLRTIGVNPSGSLMSPLTRENIAGRRVLVSTAVSRNTSVQLGWLQGVPRSPSC